MQIYTNVLNMIEFVVNVCFDNHDFYKCITDKQIALKIPFKMVVNLVVLFIYVFETKSMNQ